MSVKNTAGTKVVNFRRYQEDQMIDAIDKREQTGMRYLDEAEKATQNYTTNEEGRCWSF